MTETAVVIPFDRDAAEIGGLYRRARASMAESVRSLIEVAQKLEFKKISLQRGEWLPWLRANEETLGFGERAAQRILELSKYDVNVVFDDQELLRLNRLAWGNNVRGTEGTGENEWYTPPEYIQMARSVLGKIDLDPATSEQAQPIVQATNVFTKEDDGLIREWNGRVWLNPPYAQPFIAQFVSKICAELRAGRVTEAIMLTHNYTDTEWFHEASSVASAICFTRGRVKFYEPGGKVAAPTQGQAFFYFGTKITEFIQEFKAIGFIVQPLAAMDRGATTQ